MAKFGCRVIKTDCGAKECGEVSVRYGFCRKHSYRYKRYGDPLASSNATPEMTPDERLRFTGWVETPGALDTPCWIWSGKCYWDGYGRLSRRGKALRAHRVAYETWIGPIPEGLLVRHKCDTRKCINPSHLETGTFSENMEDRGVRGGTSRGEDHYAATIDWKTVREIRGKYTGKRGEQTELAKEYGVSAGVIWTIVNYKGWIE